jgi:hypothetical protein
MLVNAIKQQTVVKIKTSNISIVEAWCMKHVGPRSFWIHNKRGGQGWMIIKGFDSISWDFVLEDPKKMTQAMLTLSGKL